MLWSFQTLAQTDFNNYITLQAQGKIPLDFSKQTSLKVEEGKSEDREGLNKQEEVKFLEMIHYGIDNILHSGLCVYGDPLSMYINEVADNLLKDDKELRNKLRFYTIKSNEANAFSTDQGIVFMTTGLIAQFSNEAQLAFVLAHEISHFTEKHVVQSFDWNLHNNNHDDYFEKMSTYSKDKEFSADKIAVELCHKAGYSDDALFNAFDVLMYSYLPFDEIEFPVTYFNSAYYYIPASAFPDKKYEIKAEEDYNDTWSSHPNVKKRKDTVDIAIARFSNWSDQDFLLESAKFYEMRNIARFESVRCDVIDGQFAKALYSIFILEKDFPNSKYLARMKAQSWYGLYLYKSDNRMSDAVESTSNLEGESAALHYFLKKLNSNSMQTLALRTVYDLQKKYPEDKEIQLIYSKLVDNLSQSSRFKLDEYSNKTFEVAAAESIAKNDSIALADSMKSKTTETAEAAKERQSKYDKIKKKKDPDSPETFDSTKYYIYGLSDIIADDNFKTLYEKYKAEFKIKEEEEERIDNLPYRERKKIYAQQYENESKLGLKEIILVEPTVISSDYKGPNNLKSEELETELSAALDYIAEELGTSVYHIDKRTLEAGGTDNYNERSALMTLLQQIITVDESGVGIIPVDYTLLQEIQSNYGTTKVMFTLVDHYKRFPISIGGTIGMVFVFPGLPLYVTRQIFTANSTEVSFIVLDLEKGTADYANTYYYTSPTKKWYLRSYIYTILSDLTKTPQ